MKRLELVGKKFGRLTVTDYAGNKYGKPAWLCKCDCGTEKVIGGHVLRKGMVVSCGCYRKNHLSKLKIKDLLGKKFGRLEVVGLCENKNGRGTYWLCKCECGKEKIIHSHSLVTGASRSCGCLQKEIVSKMFSNRTDVQGCNNPNYNPHKTDQERIFGRYYTGYKEWKFAVKERDSFTCKKCGQVGGTLHSHHVNSYSTDESMRTEIKNGITLCKKCHKEFHGVYGVKHNTRTQLLEFLNNSN